MRSPGLFACALVLAACGGGGDDVVQPVDAPAGDPDAAEVDAAAADATTTDAPVTPTDAATDARPGDGGMCTLGVEVMGILNGTGTVVSTPGGINCGADCREEVACGSTFTLIATPGPNSVFTGWGVGCTGTGACTVTVSQAFTVVVASFRGNP